MKARADTSQKSGHNKVNFDGTKKGATFGFYSFVLTFLFLTMQAYAGLPRSSTAK